MITLCLGGRYDGRLIKSDRPDFYIAAPLDQDHFRQERYRREQFYWNEEGKIWLMWVYLHEHMSERVAMDELFGTRGDVRRNGEP